MTLPVCPNSRADIALECYTLLCTWYLVCSNELEVFFLPFIFIRHFAPLHVYNVFTVRCVAGWI